MQIAQIDSPFKNIGGTAANLTFGLVIGQALPYVFAAAGIILVFMIIASGYQMMMSAGDPKVFQAAKGRLTSAVIGILIMFFSFFIVKFVLQFLGLSFDIDIFN